MTQVQLVTRKQAVSRRVISDGRISKVHDYFGGAGPASGPQAYLIEEKNYITRPHFHPCDQFQILLGAPGSLFGRRQIGELEVHYADSFTVYGPLVSGDPAMRYFTLRAEPTNVIEFMPESRSRLPGKGGRSLHRNVERAPTDPAPGQCVSWSLIDDERDNVRVTAVAAAPAAEITIPAAGPVGQFLFVVEGTFIWGDEPYGPESIGWQPAGDPGGTGLAGSDGATLLTLRYPGRQD